MRITAKLSTAGESGFIQIPLLEHSPEYYLDENGSLKESMVRTALSSCNCIQFSSNDDGAVIAFAVELLDRMKLCMQKILASDKGVQETNKNSKVTSAERRFNKGLYSFARVDIRFGSSGYTIKVSAENPKEVVGECENFAKIYAQKFADNIVAIKDAIEDSSNPVPILLVEGNGCEGIFATARKNNDDIILRDKFKDCDRRKNGLCSPFNPSCPLYKDGRCTWK